MALNLFMPNGSYGEAATHPLSMTTYYHDTAITPPRLSVVSPPSHAVGIYLEGKTTITIPELRPMGYTSIH